MTRSTIAEDYQMVPRPVAAMAKGFAAGHRIPPHSHPRGQLLHAVSGTMRVVTPAGAFMVPPLRAVWIPPGLEHEVHMAGPVEMRTLYIAADADPGLPQDCRVLDVSLLLRELILAAIAEPVEYDTQGRAGLVMQLILAELRRLPAQPLGLPMPQDIRLRRLCDSLLNQPGSTLTLEDWASQAGASARTLARLFQRETGMSFRRWRERARLADAMARLAQGEPVARVARLLGYDSASAFSVMFRRQLGVAPQRYIRGHQPSMLVTDASNR
ncbi:helix-turn-helix transcriptional regulator [Ferrovibrio sp.]|uniref:AraC family transcriptional regulator n=1 Tax=Ferrovibrio sp. TaxID=1917215 RepID=UPI0025B844A6|nr:helix-turn-helix transcriptional regulator [Ferrovibrio sp.]MBX3453957.1 helix-turn-helix transcriptional regulator [Ferrovibrio sp.]